MPFTKVLIHMVWSTKKREPILTKELREKVFDHIRANANDKGIILDTIGGYVDHVHALFVLKHDQTLSKIAMLLKGESSHWVNENNLSTGYFEWQDEYFAVSVSESMAQKVRDYILNQEEHHRTKTYAEEDDEFRKRFGFKETNKGTK
ncbi:MAG: IS200/IS605 family transposase [Ignavibacteriae bacterium]|nr:IS200/IS605 family transposase [Ignavibacteriota bacterium]